ncbi:Ribonuclease HI [Pediococcus damnosus]|uniref:Ribonuclease H n=1 Tax=Pediococcus damnosus TaxID=51663 RepID=A0AAC9B2R5_9LACO|nr:ribonuclease H family protein [Pediococcus damnosus]AMV60785.1 Ribonuclease HI [Pediococcus damnosus]AMV63373.1 Ribonuclease HI [Pediococcus damnosus]AMV65096.1 Ribonuclease HI [Pediococcus damnosus]AMV66722.1 Ribonuclease HI [Pediococcus damnosus]AMV69910.1 Ribonuclease HI [Pediococcus damnosus]
MAAKKKFYAVAKGKQTGIFTDWNETKPMIDGFPGAKYKGFKTEAEARQWLNDGGVISKTKPTKKVNTAQSHQANDTEIIVYTDGGSRNTGNVNGGHVKKQDKAAWAYLINVAGKQISDSQGEFGATNNRMEIMALLRALEWLVENQKQTDEISVVTDSQYVLNAIQKHWLAGWKRRGWKRGSGQPLANSELWRQLDGLLPKFSHLQFYWTKGHATNEGNVFVDHLLNQTMDKMSGGQVANKAIRASSPAQTASKLTKKAQKKSVPTSETQKSLDAIKKSLEKLEWYND